MRLLLDNNFAPRIAKALDILFNGDHEIVALRDKFAANTPDVVWIEALNQERGFCRPDTRPAHPHSPARASGPRPR